MAKMTKTICKNVFKNNNKEILKQQFTKKWIELINQKENNKTY